MNSQNKNINNQKIILHPLLWMTLIAAALLLSTIWFAPDLNAALASENPAPLIPTESTPQAPAAITLPPAPVEPCYVLELCSTHSYQSSYQPTSYTPATRFLVGL